MDYSHLTFLAVNCWSAYSLTDNHEDEDKEDNQENIEKTGENQKKIQYVLGAEKEGECMSCEALMLSPRFSLTCHPDVHCCCHNPDHDDDDEVSGVTAKHQNYFKYLENHV